MMDLQKLSIHHFPLFFFDEGSRAHHDYLKITKAAILHYLKITKAAILHLIL
jgi:hypothetical protein